jgi:hypothetical protein
MLRFSFLLLLVALLATLATKASAASIDNNENDPSQQSRFQRSAPRDLRELRSHIGRKRNLQYTAHHPDEPQKTIVRVFKEGQQVFF